MLYRKTHYHDETGTDIMPCVFCMPVVICNVRRMHAWVEFMKYNHLMNMNVFSGYLRTCLKWQSAGWLSAVVKTVIPFINDCNLWQTMCFSHSIVVPLLFFIVTLFWSPLILLVYTSLSLYLQHKTNLLARTEISHLVNESKCASFLSM